MWAVGCSGGSLGLTRCCCRRMGVLVEGSGSSSLASDATQRRRRRARPHDNAAWSLHAYPYALMFQHRSGREWAFLV